MTALHAMLAEIVDYAGLFPPAKLRMSPTIRNYAAYRAGPHAWMLGRLIVPAARLPEFAEVFAAEVADRPVRSPWRLALLGSSGENLAALDHSLAADIAAWKARSTQLPGMLEGGAWELRLPASALTSSALEEGVLACASLAQATLARELGSGLRLALETPFAGDWSRTLPRAIEAIAHAQHAAAGDDVRLAAKIRTGSTDPQQVPSVEQVACFLAACAKSGLAFKATAGLHHPVRHVDPALGVRVHGFLNVFGAGAFARVRGWDEGRISALLADEELGSFEFDAGAFIWRKERLESGELKSVRQDFALSFGSCSFEEPIEDLQARGWLSGHRLQREGQA